MHDKPLGQLGRGYPLNQPSDGGDQLRVAGALESLHMRLNALGQRISETSLRLHGIADRVLGQAPPAPPATGRGNNVSSDKPAMMAMILTSLDDFDGLAAQLEEAASRLGRL